MIKLGTNQICTKTLLHEGSNMYKLKIIFSYDNFTERDTLK